MKIPEFLELHFEEFINNEEKSLGELIEKEEYQSKLWPINFTPIWGWLIVSTLTLSFLSGTNIEITMDDMAELAYISLSASCISTITTMGLFIRHRRNLQSLIAQKSGKIKNKSHLEDSYVDVDGDKGDYEEEIEQELEQ
jgi:hypothetical protein